MPRLSSLRSTKRRTLRRRKVLHLWLALIFALVSVVTAVLLFFNSRYFRVSSVVVEGDNTGLDEQARSIVEKSINGNYFWFVPKDSVFFFPSKSLVKNILAQFPSVSSVSIHRKNLTSVAVKIDERRPYAIVCLDKKSSQAMSADDKCYYADENGFIFETASSTNGAFLVYNISLPAGANPIGVDFLDGARLQAINALVGGLAKLGFSDDTVTIPSSTNYDLSLKNAKNAAKDSDTVLHLIIDESRPFPETLVDFSAFWQKYTSKATGTSPFGGLLSVDMRYGDNVIYKKR